MKRKIPRALRHPLYKKTEEAFELVTMLSWIYPEIMVSIGEALRSTKPPEPVDKVCKMTGDWLLEVARLPDTAKAPARSGRPRSSAFEAWKSEGVKHAQRCWVALYYSLLIHYTKRRGDLRYLTEQAELEAVSWAIRGYLDQVDRQVEGGAKPDQPRIWAARACLKDRGEKDYSKEAARSLLKKIGPVGSMPGSLLLPSEVPGKTAPK